MLAARRRHRQNGRDRGRLRNDGTEKTIRPKFGVHPGNPGFLWPSVTAGSDSAMNAKAYQTNKILGLVLGTALFLQAVHIIDGNFSPKSGSEVAIKGDQPAEAAAGAQPIDSLLANASAERGAQIAKQCEICHNLQEGQGPKVGPDLYGIVDRPVASVTGFNYTPAMKAKGGKWTFAALNKWLTNPRADVPGTAMTFAGLPSEKQRADVIAYLDTLSKNPVPLPKAQ
jgi:cytochrome c